jgi:muconate cycloisomerase
VTAPTIRSAQLFALDVPFLLEIAHASHTRSSCDSVILRLQSSEAVVGTGESVPRPYVTGETVQGVMGGLQRHIEEQVLGAELPGWRGDPVEALAAIEALLPDPNDNSGVVAHNSARAALEVALLDCMMRTAGLSMSEVVPSCREAVTYSGLIPTVSNQQALWLAQQQVEYGLTRLKVKVGDDRDVERLRLLREHLGPEFELYVDANCSWTPEQAIDRIEKLSQFDITLVEQPIARGPVAELAHVRKHSSIPIMADESLVRLEDARELIDAQACDIFNIRISKCGGFSNCLRMAAMARDAGLTYQLGAHVGETAVLSAAGRHLALSLPEVRYVEGSSGGFLLRDDLTVEPLQFPIGGQGRPLRGPGLGIEVPEERLRSLSREQRHMGAAP